MSAAHQTDLPCQFCDGCLSVINVKTAVLDDCAHFYTFQLFRIRIEICRVIGMGNDDFLYTGFSGRCYNFFPFFCTDMASGHGQIRFGSQLQHLPDSRKEIARFIQKI